MEEEHNFLNAYLCGTKLFDVNSFYSIFDEYKKSKEKIPIYLYSINQIDKYRFEQRNLNFKDPIVIKNETKGTPVKFNLASYLEEFNPIISGLSLKDYYIEYLENGKKANIYLSEESQSDFEKLKNRNFQISDDYNVGFSSLILEDIFKAYIRVGDILLAFIDQLSEKQRELSGLYSEQFIMEIIKFLSTKEFKKISIPNFKYESEQFKEVFDGLIEKEYKEWQSKGNNKLDYKKIVNYLKGNFTIKFVQNIVQGIYTKGVHKELLNHYPSCDLTEGEVENILQCVLIKYYKQKFSDSEDFIRNYYHNHIVAIVDREIREKFFIYENNKVRIASFQVWEIVGDKSYAKYLELEKQSEIVLENLYIGQAFGKEGSRNVLDRLGNGHEKLQRAQANCPQNKEIVLLFFKMNPKNIFMQSPGEKGTGKEFLEFINLDKNIPDSELVNICEIGLINFFKPQLNENFVNGNFTKEDLQKYKSVVDIIKNYEGIILELDCEKYNITIESETRKNDSAFTSGKRFIKCYLANNDSQLKKTMFNKFNEYN
ncbi:MAG: hypothetical protein FWH31_01900 [Streptococcaceae bacterium]|nr:hypothetical protein [Streptococcaceae bacterium]